MKIINYIKKRLKNDWDILIIITGEEGCGKSTLAQILGFQLDPNFDQTKNISYIPTPKNIMDKFNALNPYSVFVIDEATEVFYKMDFMKDFQKSLIKMYKRERKQNKCTILCMPSFLDLTKGLRVSRVKLWIHVVERGVAVIFTKYPSPFANDPWLLDYYDKEFMKRFRKKSAPSISSKHLTEYLKTLKIYWTDLNFNKLPADKWNVYAKNVKAERDKFYTEKEEEEKAGRLPLSEVNQRMIEFGVEKQKDRAFLIGCTPARLSQLEALYKKLNC